MNIKGLFTIYIFIYFICVCLFVCVLAMCVCEGSHKNQKRFLRDGVRCCELCKTGARNWTLVFCKTQSTFIWWTIISPASQTFFFLLICQKLTNHRPFLSSMYKMNVANSLQMIETWFLLCALWERMHPLEN